jgi:porin
MRTWAKAATTAMMWALAMTQARGQTSAGAPDQSNPANPAAPTQSPANPAAPPPPPPSFATAGPVTFSGALTADLVGIPAGGISSGLKVLTKTALSASYDGSSGPLPGWTAQATLQFFHGGHPSAANVGDIQGFDNIEAPNALKLYELWIARQWKDGAFGIKVGLTDLNVDFDTQQVAALFLNSSDGVGGELGHSGLNGPSIYPTTTIAVSGFWKPNDDWTLRAGMFNGVAGSPEHPGAFLAIRPPWEAGLLLIGQAERQLPGGVRAELGGWAYTSGLDALHEFDPMGNPLHLKRDRGLYGLVEGPIRVGERTSLAGWVRAGIADPVVQRVSGYIGMGLVASGLIPSRREDQAGIAVNHVIVDDPSVPPDEAPAKHAETAFELTYKTQVRDWLAIQPDLQYIVSPNGDPHQANALVLALRFSIALTHNLTDHISSAP